MLTSGAAESSARSTVFGSGEVRGVGIASSLARGTPRPVSSRLALAAKDEKGRVEIDYDKYPLPLLHGGLPVQRARVQLVRARP